MNLKLAVLVTPVLALPPALAGQESAARRILEGLRDAQGIPGLSVAVGLGKRVVFSEGFGLADLESGTSVHPGTRFRIGSVSKPLTAAGMAVLFEGGELDPDRPIGEYGIPFPDQGHPITSRQLAGHLGGIRHYRQGGYFNREHFESVAASLQVFRDDPLLHEPGSKYSYSTYGYVLLSAVMEAASGQPFLELMQQRVFEPLGMSRTVPDRTEQVIAGRAEFYDRSDGVLVNAPSEDYSYKWAGGGFLSTAEDLVRFTLGLRGLLKPATLSLLFESQTTSSGEETGYGMGWRPDRDHRGREVAHHGGSSEGARAFLLLYPEEQLAIALLANVAGANLFEGEAECVAELFLPEGAMTAPAPDGLEGLYRFSATVDGEELKGKLSLNRSGEGYQGWLSRFYSSNARVVHACGDEERVRLVVATRSGLANLWLRFGEEGFEGRWGWDVPRWPFSGVRIED